MTYHLLFNHYPILTADGRTLVAGRLKQALRQLNFDKDVILGDSEEYIPCCSKNNCFEMNL
jgi:hypothetical protein